MKCYKCGLIGKPEDFLDLVYDEKNGNVVEESICPLCKAINLVKECTYSPVVLDGHHAYNLDGKCINCGEYAPLTERREDGFPRHIED